jgi:hypothetical protein
VHGALLVVVQSESQLQIAPDYSCFVRIACKVSASAAASSCVFAVLSGPAGICSVAIFRVYPTRAPRARRLARPTSRRIARPPVTVGSLSGE